MPTLTTIETLLTKTERHPPGAAPARLVAPLGGNWLGPAALATTIVLAASFLTLTTGVIQREITTVTATSQAA